MSEIIKFIAGSLILIGTFLSLAAAFGVLRLPDVYTRNHAASKSTTLGVMSILLGTFLYFFLEEKHFNIALILGIGFIFLTAPVAGHLISRAAYNSGVNLWGDRIRDDLKTAEEEKRTKL